MSQDESVRLWVRSILGSREKRGLIELLLNEKSIIMMDLASARDFHRNLGAAIEAAQTDEFLFTFLSQRLGLPDDKCAAVLQDFREMRKAMGTSE